MVSRTSSSSPRTGIVSGADRARLRERADDLIADQLEVRVAHRLLEAVGALLVDHLREDEDHRDLLGELAHDLDVVVLDACLAGVHAVPEQVDVLLGRALAVLGDQPLVVADDRALGVAELDALGVVERHRDLGVLEALDHLRDRPADAGRGERLAEDRVDQRALADAGLADDEDVRVAELLRPRAGGRG